MIRITNINGKYTPITIRGGSVTIAFDYEPYYDIDEDGNKVETNLGTWSVHSFTRKPSFGQLKNFILAEINKRTDEAIISTFKWNDTQVWLSTENQLNYKTAYDLAVQSEGSILPVTFKFGAEYEPVYYTFDTIEELSKFYISMVAHINKCLQEGWNKKDSINWSEYEELLNKI